MHRGRWITAGVISGVAVVAVGGWWTVANNPAVARGPMMAGGVGTAETDPSAGPRMVLRGNQTVLHASITNDGTTPFTLTGVVSPTDISEISLSAVFERQADFSGTVAPHSPTFAEVSVAPGRSVGVVLTVTVPPCSKRTLWPQAFEGAEFTVRSLGVTTTHWVDLDLLGPLYIPGRDAHGKCAQSLTG